MCAAEIPLDPVREALEFYADMGKPGGGFGAKARAALLEPRP